MHTRFKPTATGAGCGWVNAAIVALHIIICMHTHFEPVFKHPSQPHLRRWRRSGLCGQFGTPRGRTTASSRSSSSTRPSSLKCRSARSRSAGERRYYCIRVLDFETTLSWCVRVRFFCDSFVAQLIDLRLLVYSLYWRLAERFHRSVHVN